MTNYIAQNIAKKTHSRFLHLSFMVKNEGTKAALKMIHHSLGYLWTFRYRKLRDP